MFKRLVVTGAAALLLLVLIPSPGAMASGASGTIHDVNGQGVGGAFVMLFDNGANAVGYAITAPDGSFAFLNPLDNTPLSDVTVDGTDGFVVEQQSNPPQVGSDNLGIYQYQPRAYLKAVNTPVDIVLPLVSSFVLKGCKQDNSLMRWGDYVSSGPGQEGAAFAYMTNLDEEEQPAVVPPGAQLRRELARSLHLVLPHQQVDEQPAVAPVVPLAINCYAIEFRDIVDWLRSASHQCSQ